MTLLLILPRRWLECLNQDRSNHDERRRGFPFGGVYVFGEKWVIRREVGKTMALRIF